MTATTSPDLAAQATRAYARAADGLAATGLGWADAERVVEYVSVEGCGALSAVRAARPDGCAAAVSTVMVDRLRDPGRLVDVVVRARPGGPPATGTVFLDTILPLDEEGQVVAEGDLRGQVDRCLELAGEQLAARGLDLSHVVKTIDYTTPATRDVYPRMGRPRRERLGPVYPGAAGILSSRLHRPDVLVALDVTASTERPEAVNPGWKRYETLTYNPAVRAAGTLHLAGFAALDLVTQEALHPGDPAAQTRATYAAILEVLEEAGVGPEALEDVVEYVCPPAAGAIEEIAAARREVLGDPGPDVTVVICGGLLRPEFLLEVDSSAVLLR